MANPTLNLAPFGRWTLRDKAAQRRLALRYANSDGTLGTNRESIMPLPLKESRAVRELAEILYDFLPASGSAAWKGHVTFKSVAEKVGVGDFWQPGSKLPMLSALLERTLEFRRGRFEPLVVEIVRVGLTYRQKKACPLTPEEVEKINGLILEIGFKFPDLWDPDFFASLRASGAVRAAQRIDQEKAAERLRESQRTRRNVELEEIKRQFLNLHESAERQHAGLQLEKLLNRIFALHDLAPREPFRVIGEQIDGSFELDYEVYLLEAKWQQDPSPAADLYIFREKVEGKSKFTRGVFLSINGVSKDAQDAISRGKQPNFFIIDGYDVMMLLEDNIDLCAFLRRRQRLLAEEGRGFVPFREL
jgi:hypothetical protein